jgi:hypothetical protein
MTSFHKIAPFSDPLLGISLFPFLPFRSSRLGQGGGAALLEPPLFYHGEHKRSNPQKYPKKEGVGSGARFLPLFSALSEFFSEYCQKKTAKLPRTVDIFIFLLYNDDNREHR